MSGVNPGVLVAVVAATRIKFEGTLHEPGDTFEVLHEEFERLLEGGAVKPVGTASGNDGGNDGGQGGQNAGNDGGSGGMTVADAIVELAAAVTGGRVTKEAAYTQSGKPDCNALADIIGREVSAAERDEAVALLEAQAGNAGGSQE